MSVRTEEGVAQQRRLALARDEQPSLAALSMDSLRQPPAALAPTGVIFDQPELHGQLDVYELLLAHAAEDNPALVPRERAIRFCRVVDTTTRVAHAVASPALYKNIAERLGVPGASSATSNVTGALRRFLMSWCAKVRTVASTDAAVVAALMAATPAGLVEATWLVDHGASIYPTLEALLRSRQGDHWMQFVNQFGGPATVRDDPVFRQNINHLIDLAATHNPQVVARFIATVVFGVITDYWKQLMRAAGAAGNMDVVEWTIESLANQAAQAPPNPLNNPFVNMGIPSQAMVQEVQKAAVEGIVARGCSQAVARVVRVADLGDSANRWMVLRTALEQDRLATRVTQYMQWLYVDPVPSLDTVRALYVVRDIVRRALSWGPMTDGDTITNSLACVSAFLDGLLVRNGSPSQNFADRMLLHWVNFGQAPVLPIIEFMIERFMQEPGFSVRAMEAVLQDMVSEQDGPYSDQLVRGGLTRVGDTVDRRVKVVGDLLSRCPQFMAAENAVGPRGLMASINLMRIFDVYIQRTLGPELRAETQGHENASITPDDLRRLVDAYLPPGSAVRATPPVQEQLHRYAATLRTLGAEEHARSFE
jgi:hypothetical protein